MFQTVPKCAKACKTRDNSNILHNLAQFSTVLHALAQIGTILHSLAHTIFNCKILFLPNHSTQFSTVQHILDSYIHKTLIIFFTSVKNLSWAKLCKNVPNCIKLLKTVQNCAKLCKTVRNCAKLRKMFKLSLVWHASAQLDTD